MRLIRGQLSTVIVEKIADDPAAGHDVPGRKPSDLAGQAVASYGIKRPSLAIFAPESSYRRGLQEINNQ
jgi:hypothetical protein